ncbi:MAG TPA: CPBP family intramembrane glutamic endopeptidase [Luteimicrobium sp.]|nr:CPBP family intramembrane glutamic endopeptidase [Luteimicrobium sp.]
MDAHERLTSEPGTDGGAVTAAAPGRSAFWGRPTTGKALLLVVGYLVFYLVVSLLVGQVFSGSIDPDDLLSSPGSILLGVALPIAIGGAGLAWFAVRRGWWAGVVARQTVPARRWMWIAPVLVVVAVAAHLAATDWGSWSGGQIAAIAVLGVCIGFTEELATRGIVVKLLRDAGHRERYVVVVSSLLFALMHMVNLISGMKASTVLATVVYAFGFGACMYLSMRLTGTVWTAIVLHALTDPTTMLATGGIDTSTSSDGGGATALALVATLALIVFGVVAAFFVRGSAVSDGSAPSRGPDAGDRVSS